MKKIPIKLPSYLRTLLTPSLPGQPLLVFSVNHLFTPRIWSSQAELHGPSSASESTWAHLHHFPYCLYCKLLPGLSVSAAGVSAPLGQEWGFDFSAWHRVNTLGWVVTPPDLPPPFFFKLYLFIYLFLAVLGLRFCARAFSSCGERGPLFIAVCGPLTVAASLVAEHRLSSCGSRA